MGPSRDGGGFPALHLGTQTTARVYHQLAQLASDFAFARHISASTGVRVDAHLEPRRGVRPTQVTGLQESRRTSRPPPNSWSLMRQGLRVLGRPRWRAADGDYDAAAWQESPSQAIAACVMAGPHSSVARVVRSHPNSSTPSESWLGALVSPTRPRRRPLPLQP
jgi:hypothetical protein